MSCGIGYLFHFMQESGCRASLDSFMNVEDFGPSLRSRGLLLQSAETAQSTMDYSTMAVDDGVVDSPVARASIPNTLNSPSPLWPRSVPQSPPTLYREDCTVTKRALYDREVDVDFDVVEKVCAVPFFK